MMKKIIFVVLILCFFLLPWLFPALRDSAPGVAVLSGIIFAVCWGNPFRKLTGKLSSPLLGAAIVGMGFGMNLHKVLQAGADGFLYTFIGIVAGISLGVIIGKCLHLPKNVMYLTGVGTSICGGSAIAAAAPALKAKEHEVAMASAVVFALNAVALFVFPTVGKWLGFSETQFGYWAALAVHDTSSVVGATLQYGSEALEVGTTVKLARALWIVPVTIFLAWFVAGKEENGQKKFKLKVPWFIPGFILAAALVTYLPQWIPALEEEVTLWGSNLKELAKNLMVVTLFLIGSNLSREKLKELGWRPVLHGIVLWGILGLWWAVAIYYNCVECS